jgi:hypothetical protein
MSTIPTEETVQATRDSNRYTPLNVVKENSCIHPNTSSTKIIKQYLLPERAFTGKGRHILVLNEFLDEDGRLKPQNGKVFQVRSRKETQKLEKIVVDEKITSETESSTIKTENTIPIVKHKSTYVRKSDAPNYMTLKELVENEGLRTWTHGRDVLALNGVPQDFMIGKRGGLRINPVYVNDDKKLKITVDFSPLRLRKYNTKGKNKNAEGKSTKYLSDLDKDRITLNQLINNLGLYKLTTRSQILNLENIPDDFFMGGKYKSQVNPAYLDKDKNLTINIDFSTLKPRQVKHYKSRKQSHDATSESYKSLGEKNVATLTESIESVKSFEKSGIRQEMVNNPSVVYRDGQSILKELSNIIDALTPMLLKPVLPVLSDEDKVQQQPEIKVEDMEEYKQLYHRVQTLETEVENSRKAYRGLENSYRTLLQSSKRQSTEKSVEDLGEVVSKTEHESLKKKFNMAIDTNTDLLAELEQLKYINKRNTPGPIDISRMFTDAEKLILLIQKMAIEYGRVDIIPENNGITISSMCGTDRVIHYSSLQKDALQTVPIGNSKKYDLRFGQYKSTVEHILNTFLKITLPCVEPIHMDLARTVYNKEISIHPRQEEEKCYIAEFLFEKQLGQALLSHGTDGTKANPVILRAITNTFRFHREGDFIKLLETYLPNTDK